MKLVLLSGGSGKRLWPLSNNSRSKQFLKVLRGPSGQFESMVQRIWRQLKSVGLQDAARISTGKSHIDILQNQLGDVPLIIEPECRDTFPAIALASTYLYSIERIPLDEIVCFMPADPYVGEEYYKSILKLEEYLIQLKADLALIGKTPDYAATNFGYIIPKSKGEGEEQSTPIPVRGFVEKPCADRAKELIDHGALWNCGVFAFKLGFILSLLEQKGLPKDYNQLLESYGKLPISSFDYEVVEKAQNIIAIPFNGSWFDLGTWSTLTAKMDSYVLGKGMVSSDSINTHLINELNLPVSVLGLTNTIVAVSPDGILVSEKSASDQIKQYVKDNKNRPMYEERRWGCYRVLEHIKTPNGNEVLTKRIKINQGKNISYQLHQKRNEVWTIISGDGEFAIDGKIYRVKPNDVLQIPVGVKHGIMAISNLEFIEVQLGSELIEEDIQRIYMTWEEVEQNCARD
ncbi:sugar phosphate nucleotidyltransferase [Ammoniphilus sp. CFH 90114]|uniref:sugar phosphate nucleotidyltransferase n=1 Tax=Ammoniphilus sp. CFH 90114 TaxID=2493665 RepID=UPI00100F957A|nr:sugar phosphate nucleotidyltransferase [Ammoniphilus sp. CFH 90114]RXT13984.1 cupin domain-containing protein [Ammoniphilus sp. CFH 90114]